VNPIVQVLAIIALVMTLLTALQTGRLSAEKSAHKATEASWQLRVKEADLRAHQDALERTQTNRETESLANLSNAKVTNEISRLRDERDRALASANQRLRDAAVSYATNLSEAGRAAATTCRDSGAPAVAVLPDETRRDLVALAEEAQRVSDRLFLCQSYLNNVIGPALWNKPKQ
jgi:hypothetical protein